jgi:hypothetical protein
LADEVRASEARVENVADALARIGYSETLAHRLRTDEAKLSELRAQLARTAPAQKPKVSVAQVVAALGGLEALASKRPEQARAALSAVVESIVLRPGEDGKVRATLQIKKETAALAASGRPSAEVRSCGGRI